MSLTEVATQRYRGQVALGRRIAAESARWWAKLDTAALDASWRVVGPQVFAVVTAGQLAAAVGADAYLDAALVAQGLPTAAEGGVFAARLAGIASDGRDLRNLLYEPVIGVKAAIRAGATPARAMTGGLIQMDTIVRTQIADAGRVADGVALTARRHVTGYVRMLSPPSCPRCAILAGRWYRWNAGFSRHPRCDCRSIPASEDVAGDLRTDPTAAFHAGRVTGMSKADEQAVRDGADLAKVVNARRGVYTAAGRTFTHAGARRSVRLMPEQIYREAKGNRDEAIRLLRLHGYLAG